MFYLCTKGVKAEWKQQTLPVLSLSKTNFSLSEPRKILVEPQFWLSQSQTSGWKLQTSSGGMYEQLAPKKRCPSLIKQNKLIAMWISMKSESKKPKELDLKRKQMCDETEVSHISLASSGNEGVSEVFQRESLEIPWILCSVHQLSVFPPYL